jgi:uncharacterized protein YyaL (SSP411 family)
MSAARSTTHTNRLAGETSPYLLQHAHNPVDWYPWGQEALAKARAEDKPILLSIGYSACHWCHVMERESFEDEETAALMNRSFVSVKVDREERPDLDAIYMQAVQMMTGHGGWPMTVFLTPDGQPFWGGTYFPPEDRQGMPSFKRVLSALADAWQNRRSEVVSSGRELSEQLTRGLRPVPARGSLGPQLLLAAAENLVRQYDEQHGGFGGAPKFPQPMAIEFLLRQWHRTGNERMLEVAERTLENMARGGMYDQLGGGFHRYSVDAHWLVPHFEKMLYDNAQLARAYLMGYQATGNAFFHEIAEETLDYVLRDMTDRSGGFYSTEDADSEGEEGKFYVWTPSEVRDLLGEEDARLFSAYYGVTDHGNFEHGKSILHVTSTPAEVAQRLGVEDIRMLMALERGRQVLLQARQSRVRPDRDEKVLAAWNGMMLRAFAEGARILGREDYRQAAIRNGEFLLGTMRGPDGRIHRTWKPGHEKARLNGYLEDYANLADGLIALYEATFDRRWLTAAVEVADALISRFADQQDGGFFDTSMDHEALITRPKDLFDNATPSGNSVAADVLLRLATLTGKQEYRRQAQTVLELIREPLVRYPLGFARLLSALDFFLSAPKEVAIIGQPGAPDTEALIRVVFERFVPNKVLAGAAPDDHEATEATPLLEQRSPLDGKATAYVCEHYTCLAPVTNPDELRQQLLEK